jgi:hypothetical protein
MAIARNPAPPMSPSGFVPAKSGDNEASRLLKRALFQRILLMLTMPEF